MRNMPSLKALVLWTSPGPVIPFLAIQKTASRRDHRGSAWSGVGTEALHVQDGDAPAGNGDQPLAPQGRQGAGY